MLALQRNKVAKVVEGVEKRAMPQLRTTPEQLLLVSSNYLIPRAFTVENEVRRAVTWTESYKLSEIDTYLTEL